MIVSIRHKGLDKFYGIANKAGINALHIKRLGSIFARLDVAESVEDMDFRGLISINSVDYLDYY